MRKVKIVCTLGPATAGVPRLVELIEAGMDVARLNFSHVTTTPTARPTTKCARRPARWAGPSPCSPTFAAPKFGVGRMTGGQVPLERGKSICLTTTEVLGTSERVSHTYLPLARDVKPGDPSCSTTVSCSCAWNPSRATTSSAAWSTAAS